MFKLAILKNASFELKKTFEELTDSEIQKKCNIEYDSYSSTKDLWTKLCEIFGKGSMVMTDHCYYDQKYIIYAFTVNNDEETVHKNVIFAKREIVPNDTYEITNFNEEYKFVDVSNEDIYMVIRNKSMINCVFVGTDNTINDEKILFITNTNDIGKCLVKSTNKELIYLNVSSIFNTLDEDKKHDFNRILIEKTNAYCAKHSFIQVNLGFAILNCIYETDSEDLNKIISSMFTVINDGNEQKIFGNAILFLQVNSEYDNETILHLNKHTFEQLYKLITGNRKIVFKNKVFLNIYRELEDHFTA
jgi:hypothetical protein